MGAMRLSRVGERAHLVASQSPGRDGAGHLAVAVCGTVWRLRQGVDVAVQGTELMCFDCVRLTLPELKEAMDELFAQARELEQRFDTYTRLMEAEES